MMVSVIYMSSVFLLRTVIHELGVMEVRVTVGGGVPVSASEPGLISCLWLRTPLLVPSRLAFLQRSASGTVCLRLS